MSRGSLEFLPHHRYEPHLIKEHRIRIDIPAMALYDREGREILGVSLQEDTKKAKYTNAIAPRLDLCRPLVGQDTVPLFSAVTSPTENNSSQINIREFGLRHGGHINTLTSIYDELARLASSNQLCTQNWSSHQLFVSISLSFPKFCLHCVFVAS